MQWKQACPAGTAIAALQNIHKVRFRRRFPFAGHVIQPVFKMSILQAILLSAPSAAPLATVFRGSGGPFLRAGRARPIRSEHIYRSDADFRAAGLIDYPSK